MNGDGIRKELLKFRLIEKYGSLTKAAISLKINYFKLSRFISGGVTLNELELKTIKKVKFNKCKLDEVVW